MAVDAHLGQRIARCQGDASMRPDAHLMRIVGHEKPHVIDDWRSEPADSRPILVEIVVAQYRINPRQRFQIPQYARIADIACMDDDIAHRQRLICTQRQAPMGVRHYSHCRHRDPLHQRKKRASFDEMPIRPRSKRPQRRTMPFCRIPAPPATAPPPPHYFGEDITAK